MRLSKGGFVSVLIFLLAVPVFGAEISVTVDEVACLPIDNNGIGWATVENNIPETSVRFFFRRLHEEVEDFYYVEMNPMGEGRYWGIFPHPEDEQLDRFNLRDDELLQQFRDSDPGDDEDYLWAWWWRAKEASADRDPDDNLDTDRIREQASVGKSEPRHWLEQLDDPTFQEWLEALENEPAEFFAAVYDVEGRRIARSKTRVTLVQEKCDVELTPKQDGESENLTIGETANWQKGENVFHWLCDGIVSRLDPYDVLREDEQCRACVIAWWRRPGLIVALPTVACVGLCDGIFDDDPGLPISPSAP